MNSSAPLILAIDAALGPCSVAVARGNEILAFREETIRQTQARRLILMVQEAMAEAGYTMQDIAHIISTVGPGGFTGLRIGLSTARALAYGLSVPVHGVSTLACTAFTMKQLPETRGKQRLHAVLNAGKGEIYAQAYIPEPFTAATEPEITTLEAIQTKTDENTLIAGKAEGSLSAILSARAAALLAHTHPEILLPPEPFYLRAPDAKLPASPLPVSGGV